MKNFFLLLGGNILNSGVSKKFSNCLLVVVDPNHEIRINCDVHLKYDVRDFESVINFLINNDFQKKYFMGAYTSIDLGVQTLVKVYSFFGYTYGGLEISNFQTKFSMTKLWREKKLLNRNSLKLSRNDTMPLSFFKKNVIVKPNQSSSSRGITIIKELNEIFFKKAVDYACDFSFDGCAIVEDFIEGTEFTVEMIADQNGVSHTYAVSKKYHTENIVGNKIAVKLHYNPSDEKDEELYRISNFGKLCLSSFGLKNCFGHLELIRDENNTLHPVEIGFRSSGFIASDLVDHTSGRNYIFDLINCIIQDKIISYDYHVSDKSSMYFFYDHKPGKYIKDKEKTIMSFLSTEITSLYSDTENIYFNPLRSITSDNERHGVEILVGNRKLLTIDNIIIAEKKLYE
jgi:hypothetical protein